MNNNLKTILSISSALVLGLSFSQAGHAQTLEEQIAMAEAACQEALAIGTVEALEQFREQYGNLPTTCTAVAQVRSAPASSALFDVNEGSSVFPSGSGGGSVSSSSGIGGNGGNGSNGDGSDDGCGCTIIDILRAANTDDTGVVDRTLDDMQSRFDAQ